jgi:hypothetical protein
MPDVWMGLSHTLTGANGDSIDLSDMEDGIVLYDADVTGLGMPKYETYRSTGPALAGAKYRGTRVMERPIALSILVNNDEDTDGFMVTDRRLWDLIGDPTQPVTWRVGTPDGSYRELRMRYADSDDSFSRDPLYDGWVLYQVEFIADDPYWYGPDIELTFISSPPQNFFVSSGSTSNLFYISQALTTSDVYVDNPGDVDAHVIWEAIGPLSNLDFVLTAPDMTDGSLGLPDVLTGSTLVVDTDPRVATAWLDGVDITEQVDPYDPRAVPAKGQQSLSVALSGTGTLIARIRPRYRRAW